jgi:YidC/Oxa1 family membrane protein insertase
VVSDVPVDVSLPDFSPPPLQFGDFIGLGLSGFGPGGIVATSFEWIQVSTGMPWFYTIIVGTILWRFVMAYFSIKQLRYSTLLRNAPQVNKAQEAVAAAKASGDQNQIRLSAAKVQKAYKDAGVSPLSMVFLSLIQFLPPLGLFIGVQRMCNLPVEQLKHSGVSFLPDLTLVSGTAAFDPYYIMPVLGVVAMNLQLKVCDVTEVLLSVLRKSRSS